MISRLFQDQRVAMYGGSVAFVCFIVACVLAAVDNTQILGIDRWIKPIKFFISIAIFMWTVGVYLNCLRGPKRFANRISYAISAIFIVEMTAIVGQALRGTTSHFNVAKPFDGAVYAVMGLAISLNTVLVGVIAYRYFTREIDLSPTLFWGMRLGLILFLLGSIEGGYMSAQTGHTVGVPDGGPGLPFTNWSTIAGDLRVAHFLGLHALQAVPIAALILEKLRVKGRTALTFAFAAIYLTFTSLIFVEALNGRPLIGM